MDADQETLHQLLLHQEPALARHQLSDGRRVWVRRANVGNPKLYYFIQDMVALYVFKIPPLRAVYRNPKDAIDDEASRLKALEEKRILVPQLLAYSESGLMMSDLSAGRRSCETLDALLRGLAEAGKPVLPLWQSGLDALSDVHAKGQYLSQAFVRNILLIDNEDWAFIDFEEDPIHRLTLAECQVRDLLFYLHSSVFLIDDKPSAIAHFRRMLHSATPKLQDCFSRTAVRLGRVKLRPLIAKLGRDGRRIAQAMHFIEMLARDN